MSTWKSIKQDMLQKSEDKIRAKAAEILTPEESIEFVAVQDSANADAVILTNKRLIFFRTKLFGLKFDDFMWRDVRDLHISHGFLGSTFSYEDVHGTAVKLELLDKTQANQAYMLAQSKEEEAHRARKTADLEKLKAAAINVNVGMPAPAAQVSISDIDPLESLKKLKTMLEADLISQADYDAKKAELIAKL